MDGGHLGDVRQRGAGAIAWVASERQLRSVIGSGVELKERFWMSFRRNRNGILQGYVLKRDSGFS